MKQRKIPPKCTGPLLSRRQMLQIGGASFFGLNLPGLLRARQTHPAGLQASAAAQWGVKGLVEIVVVSGFYQMFAAINQGFDIQPPTG